MASRFISLLVAFLVLPPSLAAAAPALPLGDAGCVAGVAGNPVADDKGELPEPSALAQEAYAAGETDAAQCLFIAAAGAGDATAAYNAAVIRLNEESRLPDQQTALALLSQSAETGFAMAQRMLATLHEQGRFVPASQSLAMKWYGLAAEQGDAPSQLALATQYFLGRGTDQDYRAAAHWYNRAAEAGDEGAQYILASMYERGLGVEIDLDQALVWYLAAARQGDMAAEAKAREVVEQLAAERRR